jgi:hypothetical protein
MPSLHSLTQPQRVFLLQHHASQHFSISAFQHFSFFLALVSESRHKTLLMPDAFF